MVIDDGDRREPNGDWADKERSPLMRTRPLLSEADLEALERQLEAVGFTYYDSDGRRWWGHPQLGQGRTLHQALMWAVGAFGDPALTTEFAAAGGAPIMRTREWVRVKAGLSSCPEATDVTGYWCLACKRAFERGRTAR